MITLFASFAIAAVCTAWSHWHRLHTWGDCFRNWEVLLFTRGIFVDIDCNLRNLWLRSLCYWISCHGPFLLGISCDAFVLKTIGYRCGSEILHSCIQLTHWLNCHFLICKEWPLWADAHYLGSFIRLSDLILDYLAVRVDFNACYCMRACRVMVGV